MKKEKIVFGAALLLLCIVFMFVSRGGHVFAQATPSANAATTDKLAGAINLLNGGNPQAASDLIAAIGSEDPEYPAAQCYQALCLYELNDFPGFLKQMESSAISQAATIPEVRKDLAVKYIDALFTYRKFEQVLPQIKLFQNNYPGSPQVPVVAEYQMAVLFERGMKKAIEAGGPTNQNQLNKRWTEAQTNLAEFLSRASAFQGANYSFLPKRLLKEEVWSARIILADDQAALAAIPARDTNAQERFSFLRIQFAERLHRDGIDQNLQLMADYLGKFPESDDRKRVELDMAKFSFRKGRLLSIAADAAEQSGDTNRAAGLRSSASQYFNQMRPLQSQITTNKAASIEESDVLDSREDLLYSYYLEKNYGQLLSLTASMISQSQPGDMNWMVAKLYNGMALTMLPGSKTTVAAAVLDDVLALGFKNSPRNDHYLLSAAKWRIYIAQISGDKNKAVQLVLWVNSSNCTRNIKAEFLKTYGAMAGLP